MPIPNHETLPSSTAYSQTDCTACVPSAACVSHWASNTSCFHNSPHRCWRCRPEAPRSRGSPPAAGAGTVTESQTEQQVTHNWTQPPSTTLTKVTFTAGLSHRSFKMTFHIYCHGDKKKKKKKEKKRKNEVDFIQCNCSKFLYRIHFPSVVAFAPISSFHIYLAEKKLFKCEIKKQLTMKMFNVYVRI